VEEGGPASDTGPSAAALGATAGTCTWGGVRYREVARGLAQGEKTRCRVGPAQLDYYYFKFFQTVLSLFFFKSGIPELYKIEIKYGFEEFDERNNFPYRNVSRFGLGFELKIGEGSKVHIQWEFDSIFF
jgi:hypothetical protein